MALAFTEKAAAYDSTNTGPWNTASVTATADRLYVCFVYISGTSPDVDGVTGAGLGTWSRYASADNLGSGRSMVVYHALSASPGAGAAIAITGKASTNPTGCAWVVVEVSGQTTTGTNGVDGIRQGTIGSGTSSGPEHATLAAFGASGNRLLAACGVAVDEAMTAEHTASTNPHGGSPNTTMIGQWDATTQDTTPDFDWTTSAAWRAISLEIVAAVAATNATATPDAVAVVGGVPAATEKAAAKPTPSAVASVGDLPAVTTAGTAVSTPAAVASVAAVPAPTITTGDPNAAPTPAAVAVAAAIPAPTILAPGTRLYLRDTTADSYPSAGSRSAVLVDYGTGPQYGDASSGEFSSLSLSPGASIAATSTGAGDVVPEGVYVGRFSSEPLIAQTIPAADWLIAIGIEEEDPDMDCFAAFSLYVWNPDGNSVRQYIYDDDTELGNEMGVVSATPEGRVYTVAGTGVVAHGNDLLVLEVWAHMTSPAIGLPSGLVVTLLFNGTTVVQEGLANLDHASYLGYPATILFEGDTADATPTPSTIAVVIDLPEADDAAAGAVVVLPDSVDAVGAVPAPTALAAARPTPTTVATEIAFPATNPAAASVLTVDTVTAVAALPEPTIPGGSRPTPAAVAVTAAIPAPTITATTSVTATPAAITATSSVPSPVVTGTISDTATPDTIAVVAALPAPTVDIVDATNATATPSAVAVVAGVGAPTAVPGTTTHPSVVPGTAAVPAPTVAGSAVATPATIRCTADVHVSPITVGRITTWIQAQSRIVSTMVPQARIKTWIVPEEVDSG